MESVHFYYNRWIIYVLFYTVGHVLFLWVDCAFCRDIGCELYVDHYCRDLPELHIVRTTAVPAIAKGFHTLAVF